MPLVRLADRDEPIKVDVKDITFEEGEDAPSGFVPQQRFQEEIQRRVSAAKRNAASTLLDDPEHIAAVAAKLGVELREDGTVKGSPKDTAAIEERLKKQLVAPLETKLQAASQTIEQLRSAQREAEILRYADGVKPSLKNAFLREAASALSLDEETGKWVLKGTDGPRYDASGELMGAKHLVESMRSEQPDWFQSSQMSGSGYQGTTTGGKRTYTQAEYDSLVADAAYFAKNEQELLAAWDEGRVK